MIGWVEAQVTVTYDAILVAPSTGSTTRPTQRATVAASPTPPRQLRAWCGVATSMATCRTWPNRTR